MKRPACALALMVAITGTIAVAFAAGPKAPRPTQATAPAINPMQLARNLINAEITLGFKRQPYLSLGALLQTPMVAGRTWAPLDIDAVRGNSGGYVVSLIASPDGGHFQLGITWPVSKDCKAAYFSDEKGVIYEASGLGCVGGVFQAPR